MRLAVLLLVWLAFGRGAALADDAANYRELVSVARGASDTLRDVAIDTGQLLRHQRQSDAESYQSAVKDLTYLALTLKGKISDGPLRPAAEQAEAGVAELQRCLDQLRVLQEDPYNDAERERMRLTLGRTQKLLERLLGTLNGISASPPVPTPPQ